MASAQYVIEGASRVGGQDHFYLETNACIAIPKGEDGEMEILASTQGLTDTQTRAASALGISANKILVKVKRIGKVNVYDHIIFQNITFDSYALYLMLFF